MSITKVARIAGVSHATVSRVINNRRGVAPKTIEQVRRAMREVNYTPRAPSLRRGPRTKEARGLRTGNVAFLLFGLGESLIAQFPVLTHVLQEVQNALAREGLNMILGHVNDRGEMPPAVMVGEIDGAILHGHQPGRDSRTILEPFPAVWVMTAPEDFWGDQVQPDNERIGQLAAQYFLDRGHRRLAFLNIQPHHPAYETRLRMFSKKAAESVDASVAVVGPSGAEAPDIYEDVATLERRVRMMIRDFATLSPPATGLFVPSDILAPTVYKALTLEGLAPGRDVTILSCNNERSILSGLLPCPATIDINVRSIARRATRQLLWRITNPEEDYRVRLLIKPTLVPGDENQSVVRD